LYLCGIEGWSEWRRTGFPKEISVIPPRGLPSASNINEGPDEFHILRMNKFIILFNIRMLLPVREPTTCLCEYGGINEINKKKIRK
jgi:hypothetical protein